MILLIKRIIFYILWFIAYLWAGLASITIEPSTNPPNASNLPKKSLSQFIWWAVDVAIAITAGLLAFHLMHSKLLSMHLEDFGVLLFLPLLPFFWIVGFGLYFSLVRILPEESYWRLIASILTILMYIQPN